MSLVIALYTRGRPALLVDTLRKTLDNIVRDDTVLAVLADDDDQPTVDAISAGDLPTRIMRVVRPRQDSLGEKVNQALQVPGDIYMPMVDHTRITTKGFDQKIVDAAALFPDGIGAVHVQMANASFSGYNAITRRWTEILGEIYPEYFPYWFIDHWTDDLARMIGRISFAHVHIDATQKPMTQELREPGWWATWFDAAHQMRRADAQRLIEHMDEPEATKQRLINSFELTEWRSKIINDYVRAQDRVLTGWSNLSLKDERYQRLRYKAVDVITHRLAGVEAESFDLRRPWFHPTAAQYRNILTPPKVIPSLKQAFAA